jgi:hypothetical protein
MGFANPFRSGVVITLTAQAIVFSLLALTSYFNVRPIPLNAPAPPSPPPAPKPPVEITDPRVFQGGAQVYSSLPLGSFESGKQLFTQVVPGVGIYFFPLSDMGLIYPRRNPVRRVWPGQALEREIIRRVIPKYPPGTRNESGVVFVYIEYEI